MFEVHARRAVCPTGELRVSLVRFMLRHMPPLLSLPKIGSRCSGPTLLNCYTARRLLPTKSVLVGAMPARYPVCYDSFQAERRPFAQCATRVACVWRQEAAEGEVSSVRCCEKAAAWWCSVQERSAPANLVRSERPEKEAGENRRRARLSECAAWQARMRVQSSGVSSVLTSACREKVQRQAAVVAQTGPCARKR